MTGPLRVEPLPPARITSAEINQANDRASGVVALGGGWVVFGALFAGGALLVDGQVLYGLLLLVTTAAGGGVLLKWFLFRRGVLIRAAEARKNEQARREADDVSNRLLAYQEAIRTFPASVDVLFSDLASHLDQSEDALANGRLQSFWDQIENTYRGVGAICRAFQSHRETVIHYTNLLQGRRHTFPMPKLNVGRAVWLANLSRYESILSAAEQRTEFVLVFEHRRANNRGVSFRELIEAGTTARASILEVYANP